MGNILCGGSDAPKIDIAQMHRQLSPVLTLDSSLLCLVVVGTSWVWHGCWCHGTTMPWRPLPLTSSFRGQQVSWDLTQWAHISSGNKNFHIRSILIPHSLKYLTANMSIQIGMYNFCDWMLVALVSGPQLSWLQSDWWISVLEAEGTSWQWRGGWRPSPMVFHGWASYLWPTSKFGRTSCVLLVQTSASRCTKIHWSSNVKASSVTKGQTPFSSAM